MKKIYFTVTNDLTIDQRMQRICTTLAANNFDVTLVGRELPASEPLNPQPYKQKRLKCWFNKGKLFYAEYNIRLLFFLLFQKIDGICAIDLDTIYPCYLISRIKKVQRIYDAHELFTEMKEVITRPTIKKLWERIEKRFVPGFKYGYTVSEGIAEEFSKRYGVNYEVIRNVPVLMENETSRATEKFILYQGAVNEGRGLEQLIPAMKHVDCKLVICGNGNFMHKLKELIAENKIEDKVELRGWQKPEQLRKVTVQASIGIALSEKEGLNQWLALPNKFFDYMHAGLPQITMNFPEYKKINDKYEVAVLLNDIETATVKDAINSLLKDDNKRSCLTQNCLQARKELNWQQEEKNLVAFYKKIFEA